MNFSGGTPANYFYNKDHLGSIRELTDSTGAIKTRYSYDPYGVVAETIVTGTSSADMQYAGYYLHGRSGLSMPVYRAYNAALGRFINRDPIGEKGGLNLYGYVENSPTLDIDPSGRYAQAATIALTPVGAAVVASTAVMMISAHAITNAIKNIKMNFIQMKMNMCVLKALNKWNDCRSDKLGCHANEPEASNNPVLAQELEDCDTDFAEDINKCLTKFPGATVNLSQ